MKKMYWTGDPGHVDDFNRPITDEFVDGKTYHGPWAIMVPVSFAIHGVGMGPGRGQRYRLQKNGMWLKVEG